MNTNIDVSIQRHSEEHGKYNISNKTQNDEHPPTAISMSS